MNISVLDRGNKCHFILNFYLIHFSIIDNSVSLLSYEFLSLSFYLLEIITTEEGNIWYFIICEVLDRQIPILFNTRTTRLFKMFGHNYF